MENKEEQRGGKPAGKKGDLPVCTPEEFAELSKEWEPLVRSGKKKPATAIGAMKTKYTLTQDQEFQVDAWAQEGN